MIFERLSVSERRTLPPAIAVSTVAFALRPPADAHVGHALHGTAPFEQEPGTTLWIPLVRRTRPPFEGRWALPGGPTEWHETLSDTALRTVHDAVLREPGYLEQLYAFGAVERSAEAQRLVTIAYWALYGERELDQEASSPQMSAEAAATAPARWDEAAPPAAALLIAAPPATAPRTGLAKTRARLEAQERRDSEAGQVAGDTRGTGTAGDAQASSHHDPNVAWFSADRLPELAFDHAEIIAYALWRLRVKTEYASVAHRFLGSTFTLAQLRQVHEAILGTPVDPANFRRQMLASGTLVDTGELLTGTPHRPAKLYRFAEEPDNSSLSSLRRTS
ncbi:NUDIX hydrolase [Leucobacter sp. GX24907]